MNVIITLLLSFFEWLCLFLFPIVVFGYSLKKHRKALVWIASIMSVVSFLFHHTSISMTYTIILQIILAFMLTNWLLASKMLEAFVITSMGYGFYIFIQMIFMEVLVRAFNLDHLHFFSAFFDKAVTQLLTILFVFFFSMIVQYSQFQLNEVRSLIKMPRMNRKYRLLMVMISLLMIAFIWLTAYILMIEESAYKQMMILFVMLIGFLILSFYLFLHILLQKQQILEAKKLFLDQEQQMIDRIENLKEEERQHFQSIVKLANRQACELITDYIGSNDLDKAPSNLALEQGLCSQLDELFYVLLINKRKLAHLFDVTIKVSGEIQYEVPISLQQIVCISKIIDNFIFVLSQASEVQDKIIHFHIDSSEEAVVSFTISSPLRIEEKVHENLKSYDALLELKHLGAVIHSNFQPINLSIRSPIL
ncbi:hypothetical protein MUB24_16385 [Lederbergia sp. NSJ-179]|uniref:hypothetical protein n=1 Tax=Lederbergia sp. NSJ-179 TaxID=2931402 RepID=UPI001FD093CE|nr:hypothetical protein [Lederbergia sp. NSJ-179]MCJ7842447.1 hypothetical protein [Lederbergia sp. NSJ-179]